MFDRDALSDLFDYTTFTWESYRRTLDRLPPETLTRPLEDAAWPDIAHLLFHLAAAWDDFLRDSLGLADEIDWTAGSVETWADLQQVRDRVRGWLRRLIDETPDEQLHAPRTHERWANASMSASLAEVLAHILLHERGHHGDVATALTRLGARAPDVDYLVYVWFRNRHSD